MSVRFVLSVGLALFAAPSLALSQGLPIDLVNRAIDAVGRSGLEQLKTIADQRARPILGAGRVARGGRPRRSRRGCEL